MFSFAQDTLKKRTGTTGGYIEFQNCEDYYCDIF